MISKEQFLTIKRMKADGVAVAAIARKVGVSEPVVRKWARMDEAGFDALKRNDIPYMDQYREFIIQYPARLPTNQRNQHSVPVEG